MSNVVERFLGYVKFDTKSDEESETVPTTFGQKVFGGELVSELKRMGIRDIEIDDTGYVYGTLPGNIDKKVKTIGFIAHMDTSPDMSGKRVNPRIVTNYDGGDIILNEKEDIVLSPVEFTELPMYKGKDLIVTDGLTLLGADDKAGVAEIITAVEYLINHPEIKHGIKADVVSTVGAGDSMVAALAVSLDNNFDFEKSIKLAVACGTANVTTSGTQAADIVTVRNFEKQVEFEYLNL